MPEKRKKILIVSYPFPPVGGVWTFRIAKIVKYLSRAGFEIHVICANPRRFSTQDPHFMQDVADCHVYPLPDKTSKLIPRKLFLNLLFLKKINQIASVVKPNLLYFNGGPYYYFVLGPVVKRKLGLPYVLDFRDPWYLREEFRMAKKFFLRYLEKYAVRNAERIINVTSFATKRYREHYHSMDSKRFVTIENGFDTEDFKDFEIKPSPKPDTTTIVYPGKLGTRNPESFMKAICLLINQKRMTNLRFVHAGEKELVLEQLTKSLNLAAHVFFTGFMSYSAVLKMINEADIGLLITGLREWEPTTKIYDYLALRTKILAIAHPNGYVAEVLKKTDSGVVVANDPQSIADSIVRLAETKRRFSFTNIAEYTREHQIQSLIRNVINPIIR